MPKYLLGTPQTTIKPHKSQPEFNNKQLPPTKSLLLLAIFSVHASVRCFAAQQQQHHRRHRRYHHHSYMHINLCAKTKIRLHFVHILWISDQHNKIHNVFYTSCTITDRYISISLSAALEKLKVHDCLSS